MSIPFYKRVLRVAAPLLALAALLAAGAWCVSELPDLSANAGRTVVINEVCVKTLPVSPTPTVRRGTGSSSSTCQGRTLSWTAGV